MHNIKLQHVIEDEIISKEAIDNPSFFMANKKGSYGTLASCSNTSRLQGFFLRSQLKKSLLKNKNQLNQSNNTIYKVIERIQLDSIPTKLTNNFSHIILEYGKASETFTQLPGNAFLYEVENYSGNIEIMLDCRKIFDYDQKGRIYTIKKENDSIIIEYTKYRVLNKIDYKLFVIIKGIDNGIQFQPTNNWIKKEYSTDKSNNSQPSELLIFDALKIPVKKKCSLIISYAATENEAVVVAEEFYKNKKELVMITEDYNKTLVTNELKIKEKEIAMAYKCCIKALDDLPSQNKIQTKNNDKAISVIWFIKTQRFMESKEIIMELAANSMADNTLYDGFLWKRISDFIAETRRAKQNNQYISNDDMIYIKNQLLKALVKNINSSSKNGFAVNKSANKLADKSIDRSINNLSINNLINNREGIKIEIQALRLCMIKLLLELCDVAHDEKRTKIYSAVEQQLVSRVKKAFFAEDTTQERWLLKDGIIDATIRPYIFLAYYLYPELLSNNEWEGVFDTAMQQLWLEWGGIATLDKTNQLNKNNKQNYQQGESYYFLNNIAAICLVRLNRKKYDYAIQKILQASATDILWLGIAGYASELSSAREQSVSGNQAYAPAAATFIELVNELYRK